MSTILNKLKFKFKFKIIYIYTIYIDYRSNHIIKVMYNTVS